MSFDRIARHYRWIEALSAGEQLQKCRVAWLDQVTHCRRALILGEGNGRFLAACASKLPETHFTVVDGSAAMLRLAKRSWIDAGGNPAQAEFVQATLPGLKLAPKKYDLIVTHFFLDCFSEIDLAGVISELTAHAARSCYWLLADFAIPEKGLARLRARAIVRALYTFFGMTASLKAQQLISPYPFLLGKGWTREAHVEMSLGLLYSDLWRRA